MHECKCTFKIRSVIAKNPSLMNHHVCLLIPSDWLKMRPQRQHQHQSSLQCACVLSNVMMTTDWMHAVGYLCTFGLVC